MGTVVTEKQNFPMLVGGEWVRTEVRRTIRLPYDATPVGETYEADEATTERAVTAAQAGAAAMAGLTQYERAELLDRMRRLLERDAAEFARLVCNETGKPISRSADRGRPWPADSARFRRRRSESAR
jgi:acyl-CoA reductase-like NAD-dependent aldehyde dehydrogenase